MTLGNQNHLVIFSEVFLFFFLRAMRQDVILHILVGQALIGLLFSVALNRVPKETLIK